MPSSRSPSSWSRSSRSWYSTRTTKKAPRLGEVIRSLRVDDLEGKHADARNQNLRTVGSYTWVDNPSSGPTILVPGKPPLWTPQDQRSRFKEDAGSYFRDKNAARYPKYPMEPAVIAALTTNVTNPTDVDIFACASTLGNLLRFIQGEDATFRMLAYKLHNTVFLVRRENSPTQLIPDVRGHGHIFHEANTTWESEVKGCASHQRLVRYDFGLSVIVRFEADGYIRPPNTTDTTTTSPTTPSPTTLASPAPATVDDLTTSLAATTVSPASAAPKPKSQSTFNTATRSIHARRQRNELLAAELPRLWIRQVPTFVLAFHRHGLFRREETEIVDVRGLLREWEDEHAGELQRFAALLRWVRTVVCESLEGRVEICRWARDERGGEWEMGLEVRTVVVGEGAAAGV
ncbi:47b7af88-f943-4711-bbe0-964646b62cf9 [Thermothielavioides terrestris]|uniref:47b7af88-f943-4711-bbe0-964646b62cf9 n=1 Tax=Thermothielavioides terrestris TaxID=2587410 RepID=A0A3S4F4R0_9PEZI|nr:47b7af88-f943-4711-bbe0-964646b62cf9 [Thermothielavioides terrestris]